LFRKELQSGGGRYEDRRVLSGDDVLGSMDIFVWIAYERDFHSERPKGLVQNTSSIVDFEGESFAEAQVRIIRGSALYALIANEGMTEHS